MPFRLRLVLGLTVGALASSSAAQTVPFSSSNLPIVVIDTHGQTILDEPKITADYGIISNGPGVRNQITDPFTEDVGKIGIELRGSTSQVLSPKKPYGFETRDSTGADRDVSLFGLPKESDWILNAPYSDKSLMRDALSYEFARRMGHWASHTRFCELMLNGEYQGVYVIQEKIKRDAGRVDLSKLNPTDITGNALTGGYIIKIDKTTGDDIGGWTSLNVSRVPGKYVFYQYDTPKASEITSQQKTYIRGVIDRFEQVMKSSAYADSTTGYPSLIDVNSFIDFYLMNELSRNVDGYRLSSYLYKNRDSKGGKLVAGPVWDFNIAYGGANYYNSAVTTGFQVDFAVPEDGYQLPFWWKKLADDPAFHAAAGRRWHELRRSTLTDEALIGYIDSTTIQLDEAQQRNFTRWPILGHYVWPNAYIGQSYASEVNYLKTWLRRRTQWLDANLPAGTTAVGERPTGPTGFALLPAAPNPFNPTTQIGYQLSASGNVRLEIYDALGQRVRTLVDETKSAGQYTATFDASGLPSGVYIARLSAGSQVASRRLALLR